MTLTYISSSSDFYTFYINVPYLLNYKAYNYQKQASVAQLDALSDWRPGGPGFNPQRGRQH